MTRIRAAQASFDILSALEDSLPPATRELLQRVGAIASRSGTALYIVGGPVRDILLGRHSSDLDLVVEGDATDLAFELSKTMSGNVVSYSQFGTATVIVEDGKVDLVTARREIYRRPGALPTVTPSSIEEDLLRRDFTINAMALSLSSPNTGRLLDPTNGMQDLRSRYIRGLHSETFHDDATRILRAIRYERRLGFRVEPKTRKWLLKALEDDMLKTISGDRLRREVHLLLKEARPIDTLKRAGQLGILRSLHQPLGAAHWINLLTLQQDQEDPLLFLAALIYPLSTQDAESFIDRLNMPTRWSTVIRDLVALRESKDLVASNDLSNIDLYHILECRSDIAIKALMHLTSSSVVKGHSRRYLEDLRYIKPLLRGKDLMALGVPMGPEVGQILRSLKAARLEGNVHSRKDEKELVKDYLKTRRCW